jgi:hypothetical protein
MVYTSKKGTILDALATPVLKESRIAREIRLDGNKATVQVSGKNNHGLPINLQCLGVTSPVRFRGITQNTETGEYEMHFEMTTPDKQPFNLTSKEPRDYALQFQTSTPLQKAVYRISQALLKEQRQPKEKRTLNNLPDKFDSFLRYQTQTGEWNQLPQELLTFTTKFVLRVRDVGVEYESFRDGVIKITPSLEHGNLELYEAVIQKLQQAGLIERTRTEKGNQKYDTIKLRNPDIAQVLRPLEDLLRDFDSRPLKDYEEYGGKAEFELRGKIPIATLERIPTNLSLQAGSFRSNSLVIDSYQEGTFSSSPRTTTISVNGTLEAAARTESLLTYLKDLKIQSYDSKDITQKPIPIFSIKGN